jgi:glycosyltransferase involved in cell wall biosynthesis
MNRSVRVGIIANEFFDETVGRMGGFGWVAAAAASCLRSRPDLVKSVEFLSGERARGAESEVVSHGLPLHFYPRSADRGMLGDRFDVLLSVDYRPSYHPIVAAFSSVPWIMWVNDPRTGEDWARLSGLRVPARELESPQGTHPIDCTSMRRWRPRWWKRSRRVVFGVTASSLGQKFKAAYGFEAREPLELLPYPLRLPFAPAARKSERPSVVFLGRLDPIKRPWLVFELAERLPDVEFVVMGRTHFRPPRGWEVPSAVPSNVELLGHVDGETKWKRLRDAWALVNTSIHEALPVSFVEAFAAGTPVISCQDPGSLVTKFGVFTGRFDGDGLAGVPAFVDAISSMTASWSLATGRRARHWALETHSEDAFLDAFRRLCDRAGARTGARPGK